MHAWPAPYTTHLLVDEDLVDDAVKLRKRGGRGGRSKDNHNAAAAHIPEKACGLASNLADF
jgi:hypothetical protein